MTDTDLDDDTATRAAANEAKRARREAEALAESMRNLRRRRQGHKASQKAIEEATADLVVKASVHFTYEELADYLGISRARVGQLLAANKPTRPAPPPAPEPDPTDDGLVPAVSEL